MSSITATESFVALLRQATELTEIRDPEGAIVGFFAPVSIARAPLYAQAATRIDPGEIKQRKEANGPQHTTQEVLDRLKSLETP